MGEDRQNKKDIWNRGVQTVMNGAKFGVIRYVDAIEGQNMSIEEKFKLIRGRIFDTFQQTSLNVGMLVEALKAGGKIEDWEGYFTLKREGNDRHHSNQKGRTSEKKFTHPPKVTVAKE